jgi:hypothetical protein
MVAGSLIEHDLQERARTAENRGLIMVACFGNGKSNLFFLQQEI